MTASEQSSGARPPEGKTELPDGATREGAQDMDSNSPPDDRPPRAPWLEVYVDVPNCELSAKALDWPTLINYGHLGRELAKELPGGPYYLKHVWCFASTRDFDPVTGEGKLSSQPYVAHLRAIESATSGTTLVLSHRLPPRYNGSPWEEKGVDVNLASYLIEGACDNRYSAAVVISNDSDFAGVMRRVAQRGKTVFWGFFGRQLSENDHLYHAATKPYNLSRALIRKCEWH